MRKITPILLLMFLTAFCGWDGQAQTRYERIMEEDTSLRFTDVKITSDGGFITSGYHNRDYGNGTSEAFVHLIKFDANGDTVWTRMFDTNLSYLYWYFDRIRVIQTLDGGYFLGSLSKHAYNGAFYKPYFLKLDALGDTVWTRSTDTVVSKYGDVVDVMQTSDGNYAAIGRTGYTIGASSRDPFLMKISPTGDTLWTKTYLTPAMSFDSNGIHTSDGGFLITHRNGGINLIKTNATGDTLWTSKYNINNSSSIQGVVIPILAREYANSYFVLFNVTSTNNEEGYGIMKIDLTGNVVWSKIFLNPNESIYPENMTLSSSGFAITGASGIGFMGEKTFLHHIDFSGNLIWAREYNTDINNGDICKGYSVQQTSDSGFLVVGSSQTNAGQPVFRGHIIKTDSLGFSGCWNVTPNLLAFNVLMTITSSNISVYRENNLIPTSSEVFASSLQEMMLCGANGPGSNIWPGDANADGVANNLDYLYIGLANDSTGPARSNTSITWNPQLGLDWTSDFATADNYVHADCDGSGTIQAADTTATITNYNLTHASYTPPLTPSTSLDAPLYTVAPDSVMNSQSIVIEIHAGSNSLPVSDLHGIAFSLNYDTALIDSGSIQVVYPNSWLGSVGNDVWAMARDNYSEGKIDFALTRFDLQGQDGFGKIVELHIVMPDDISILGDMIAKSGGGNYISDTLALSFSDILALSPTENVIPLYDAGDSITVWQLVNGVQDLSRLSGLMHVYPNPTDGVLNVAFDEHVRMESWTIYNVVGQPVSRGAINHSTKASVDVSSLPAGTYFIEIKTALGSVTKTFRRI